LNSTPSMPHYERMAEIFRLVTRSDFDGLVCAALLKEMGLIDEVLFTHPKEMQDGNVQITSRDIIANLPFVRGCHMTFDHHESEVQRNVFDSNPNHIIDARAPSAARVVFDHYGGAEAFPTIRPDMMEAVDRADSAQFTRDEVLRPKGWILLNFIMDPRTGLGRFHHFSRSNYQLMMDLIDYCRVHVVDEILELPDVRERTELYFEHQAEFEQQISRCARVEGAVVVLDMREEEQLWCGNRFLVYALHPGCTISIQMVYGLNKEKTVLAIGKSIFNRKSPVDIGSMALSYGGGGHLNVGTCQVPNDDVEQVLSEIKMQIMLQSEF